MKLKEFRETFNRWRDKERTPIAGLMKLLTPVSIATIHDFQSRWHQKQPVPPYEEFVVAQNKEIDLCIKLEMSELGVGLRESYHLPPLTDETEIPE